MAIQLRKGENINLTKVAPTLNMVLVGLGWDARSTDGTAFDLDASCFLLNPQGKCRDDRDVVFYQPANLNHFEGAVAHTGDNKTGAGDGDDESIKVQLDKVNAGIERLVFVVSIYEAIQRKQTFGMVNNAFIRLVNQETGEEVCRADLSEEFSVETSLNFAELYRLNGEWKFKIVSQGYQAGLEKFVTDFGLQLA
jgi:tellurium resistance protein TerD